MILEFRFYFLLMIKKVYDIPNNLQYLQSRYILASILELQLLTTDINEGKVIME